MTINSTVASPELMEQLKQAWALGLPPVLRLDPAHGSRAIRDNSDDAAHLNYTSLAAAWALVVIVGKEPNGHWMCSEGVGHWLEWQ